MTIIGDIMMTCFCGIVSAATVDSPVLAVHADCDICRTRSSFKSNTRSNR